MEKVKHKIYEMSLKKTLILFFTIFIAIIIILTGITILISVSLQRNILDSRTFSFITTDALPSPDGSLIFQMDNQFEWSPLTLGQKLLYHGSIGAMIILPIIYVVVGILISTTIYYRVKLKNPIDVLTSGILNITNGNLDFMIDYKCHDELGELGAALETMRSELRRDKKHIWELIEEKRALNASISHDLGTPITVIKGYLEYLLKNIPQDRITEDALINTLVYMSEATGRLERYIDCVRDIHKLEDMEIHMQNEQFMGIFQELESNLIHLVKKHNKKIELYESCGNLNMNIDKQIIFRIMENVIENALRYAKYIIKVNFSCYKDLLSISIEDDGIGFTADSMESATALFYTSNDKEQNLGLGLHISKVLCKKHGGQMSVGNSAYGGGKVLLTIKI